MVTNITNINIINNINNIIIKTKCSKCIINIFNKIKIATAGQRPTNTDLNHTCRVDEAFVNCMPRKSTVMIFATPRRRIGIEVSIEVNEVQRLPVFFFERT